MSRHYFHRQRMDYEVVIGLEVHSQLLTRSKMFCACAASYQDAAPNTMVCEVCMGMPGVLPTINRRAVEIVIATGLALDCTVSELSKFDRKNYPYPDLMKGYQVSQFDRPIAKDGKLTVDVNGTERTIRINRVHLEEDVAKLSHHTGYGGERYSLLDINRAGVPLMETVSEPDMRSPEEARAYLLSLHSILRYIGASTANMEEGSFRCDANISVRPQRSDRAWPEGRSQEHEQLPLGVRRAHVRDRSSDPTGTQGRADCAGDAGLGRGKGHNGLSAHQGRFVRLSLFPRARPAAVRDRVGVGRAGTERPA